MHRHTAVSEFMTPLMAAGISFTLLAADVGCSSAGAPNTGSASSNSQPGALPDQAAAGMSKASSTSSSSDSSATPAGAMHAAAAQSGPSAAAMSTTLAAMGGSSAVAGTMSAGPATSAGGGAEPPAAGTSGQAPAASVQCPELHASTTEARLHMHHIHFNTQDPDAEIAFVQKYFNALPYDYCKDANGQSIKASKTERAYFLYTKVAAPPSNMRKNRLAHIGYINADVTGELKRLNALDVPLADSTACATAAMGTPCNTGTTLWFYVDMPESARFEIATGPGPATSGFGHIHLVAPDYSFFRTVLGEALQDPNGNPNVDQVNMVAGGRTGVLDQSITYEDTRGAAIDHVGFSTGDIDGTLKRIQDAGIKIEEPLSLKPEGFRSFMVRSTEGIWLEILDGDGFKP